MAVTAFVPTVEVSWDGSGNFDGPYDDVTHDVASDPGLSIDDGLDGARALNQPKVAALDFELFNHTGKYSQDRADSPVYQRVLPSRPVRVSASFGSGRAYRSPTAYRAHEFYRGRAFYALGRNFIEDINQGTGWGNQRVGLSTLGIEKLLVATVVSVPVTAAVRVDQAIGLVLDAAGWPSAARALSVSDTMLSYFWVDERAPWDVLLELLAAEGPGVIDIDRTGVFHFQNRNYRATATRSTTPQYSVFDHTSSNVGVMYRDHVPYRGDRLYRGRASGLYMTSLTYDPGFKVLWNRATYQTTRRRTLPLAEVWNYGAVLTLTASETRTLIARPPDPFINATTPAAGVDYTVSAGAATVTLSYTSGLVAFIVVAAGGSGATIIGVGASAGLSLRAQSLPVLSQTTVQNTIDASESIAKYSPIPGAMIPRVLQVNGWPELDPSMAQAVCDAWVSRYMTARPSVTFTMRAADDDHLRMMLDTRVSDCVAIVETNSGINGDVWVNSTQLLIAGPSGAVIEATFGTEKVEEVAGFEWDAVNALWDTALWGT